MSGGSLPPLPALIPISSLRKSPPCNNNSGVAKGGQQNCAPCANRVKVMGEQRSRRPGSQPPVDLIDSARSRGPSAAPQARKTRSERYRKSDRRRDHRRHAKSQFTTAKQSNSCTSPERPANPRVNPIFVWVRQEDTRIVDVKCEDYDKRNRILLTKTPQGWRATPRTETLVPSLKEAADKREHHHHHRSKKSRKHKTRQKSTAVQVEEDLQENDSSLCQDQPSEDYPTWTSPINIESHLPSHTIHVTRKSSSGSEQSPPPRSPSVNSVVEDAQAPSKCNTGKICDVSPLDNLLAVAELEFNQQLQSDEWNKNSQEILENEIANEIISKNYEQINEEQKEFLEDMEHLKSLIESCSKREGKLSAGGDDFSEHPLKSEDCDYTEDEDNNLAMDDILSRLEQSLRSPESPEITRVLLNDCQIEFERKEETDKETEYFHSDINVDSYKADVPEFEKYLDQTDSTTIDDEMVEKIETPELPEEKPDNSDVPMKVDQPTDLSVKPKVSHSEEVIDDSKTNEAEQPTDLSIPKNHKLSPLRSLTPRPSSQESEAIQSPQPSGIPAVPPSPDIVSPNSTTSSNTINNNNNKSKSLFLESLLINNSPKIALNSEVTIERQKEPLDLGKCRKSASPTVTCSEEVQNQVSDSEPPTKKLKTCNNITLKTLLDADLLQTQNKSRGEKSPAQETPRLLELLKTDVDIDPITQLRQILSDSNLNVPDPMLVPKEKLSKIISNPGVQIPLLLKNRPELRLPDALAFPHLLKDPDILVITLQQLETIIRKQNQTMSFKPSKHSHHEHKSSSSKKTDKLPYEFRESQYKNRSMEETIRIGTSSRDMEKKSCINELASDIDAATNAAFNQMMWLPYINQMETMQFGNNPELMKMFNGNVPALYPAQVSDLSHLLGNGRFPPAVNFPVTPPINYNNPLEMSLWQEAVVQANMLRPKNTLDGLDSKNNFRDYLEKFNYNATNKNNMMNNHKLRLANKQSMTNQYYPPTSGVPTYQPPFLNVPQSYQSNSMKSNLQIPHYNPLFSQKSHVASHAYRDSCMPRATSSQKFENKTGYPNMYHQSLQDKQCASLSYKSEQNAMKAKSSAYKSYTSVSHQQKTVPHDHHKEKSSVEFPKQQTSQPIDLSGSTMSSGKVKVKQHLIDPNNATKLLKHDDVPEVGSTTASIEEMQEAHKHLWHPLFGNQKGYSSPWNWAPVSATAE